VFIVHNYFIFDTLANSKTQCFSLSVQNRPL